MEHLSLTRLTGETVADVIRLERGRLAFSEGQRAQFEACFERPIDIATWLGQRFSLQYVTSASETINLFSGILSEIMETDEFVDSLGRYHYAMVMSSPFVLMEAPNGTRLFSGQSLQERLNTVLTEEGFALRWNVSGSLPELPPAESMALQFEEPLSSFIERELVRYGLLYQWEINNGGEFELVVCDTIADWVATGHTITTHALPYQQGMTTDSERLLSFQHAKRTMTNKVKVVDYLPALSATIVAEVVSKMPVKGVGRLGIHHESIVDEAGAKNLAERRLAALDAKRSYGTTRTNCPQIKLGDVVEVVNHPYPWIAKDFGKEYRVVSITHQYSVKYTEEKKLSYTEKRKANSRLNAGEKNVPPGYSNELLLIPLTTFHYRPEGKPPISIPSWMRGEIAGNKPGEVEIDSQGRYKLRLQYKGQPLSALTIPAPLMTPLTGPKTPEGLNSGWHFPLPVGAPVVVQFLQSNVNRPVILGVLPTTDQPSLVNNQTRTQNTIKTLSGHRLVMDDTVGKESIELASSEEQHLLRLLADPVMQQATLLSQGQIQLTAGKDSTFTAGQSATIQTGGDHVTTIGGNLNTTTSTGNINIQANEDLTQTAQQKFIQTAQTGNIEINVGENFNLTAKSHIQQVSQTDNVNLSTAQGPLNLEGAKGLTLTAGQSITIKQGQATITFKDGELSIVAPSVTFNAPAIIMQGQQVNLGGQFQVPRANGQPFHWPHLQTGSDTAPQANANLYFPNSEETKP